MNVSNLGLNVTFKGGSGNHYMCSPTQNLVVGKKYKLDYIEIVFSQTNYILNGFDGVFNSRLFKDEFPTYKVSSDRIPIKGKPLKGWRKDSKNEISLIETSPVEKVEHIACNKVYLAVTANHRIYFVTIR